MSSFFFFYCCYKSNLCHCRKHTDAKRTELLPSSPPGTAQADPWVDVLPLHTLLPPQSPGTPGSLRSPRTPGSLSCVHETEFLGWESDARSSSCPAPGFCASLGRTFLSWDVRGDDLERPFARPFKDSGPVGKGAKQTQGLLSCMTNESGAGLMRKGCRELLVPRGFLE